MEGYLFGWIIFSLIAGVFGSTRKIGFGSTFFLSLILSPLIGFIIALASKSTQDEASDKKSIELQEMQLESLNKITNSETRKPKSIVDELEKLTKLRDDGSISQDEFETLKTKIIHD